MARGTYTIIAANQTVVAAPTLISVRPGTTCSIEFLRFWCSQAANATSNQQRINVNTKVSAFDTLVGVTPGKTSLLDGISAIVSGTAEAAGTSGINASAQGGGTETVMYEDAFNVLNGWLWVPTPPETLTVNASSASAGHLKFQSTPVALTVWQWGCSFREV